MFFFAAMAARGTSLPIHGTPLARTFTTDHHGSSNRALCFANGPDGLLYVGTAGGLLEFDGTAWRRFEFGSDSSVRSLVRDARGRIWAGGRGQLGRFIKAPGLETRLERLPLDPALLAGGNVEGAAMDPVDGSLVFTALDRVIWIDPEGVQPPRLLAVGPRGPRVLSWRGALYLRTETSLSIIRGGCLEPAPPADSLALEFARILLPADPDGWFGFSRDELLRFDPDRPAPGRTPLDGLGPGDEIVCALRLDADRIAVGTFRSGLIVLGKDGRLLEHWTREDGLRDSSVIALHLDVQGGLWAGHPRGITQLQLRALVRGVAEGRGVAAPTFAIRRHAGRMYIGCTEGVVEEKGGRFELVPRAPADVRGVLPVEGGLFIGGRGIALRADDGTVQPIGGSEGASLQVLGVPAISPDGLRIAVPHSAGVAIFRRVRDGWAADGAIRDAGTSVYEVFTTPDGWLWVLNASAPHARRIRWSADFDVENLALVEGIPIIPPRAWGDVRGCVRGGEVWIASGAGLFSFRLLRSAGARATPRAF